MTHKISIRKRKMSKTPRNDLYQASKRKDQVFSYSVDWIQHTIKFVMSAGIWWNTRLGLSFDERESIPAYLTYICLKISGKSI